MIPVKICGITSQEDALSVAEMGASAIGLIFYEKSPRFVSTKKAKEISMEVPSDISIVGVFVNSDLRTILRIAETVNLDFIQLHGVESPGFYELISFPVIKAIQIVDKDSLSNYRDYRVHSYLLDTFKPGIFGGTGETFNWSVVGKMETEIPVILSGGLNASNILQGIETIRPDAVDINSGVEFQPGKKDQAKLIELFQRLEKTGEYPNIFKVS